MESTLPTKALNWRARMVVRATPSQMPALKSSAATRSSV